MHLRACLLFFFAVSAGSATAEGLYPSEMEYRYETEVLVAATEALFDQLEAESAEAGKPHLDLRLAPAGADPVSLPLVGQRAVKSGLGPLQHLTGYNITWYPADNLTGTVDFVGTWESGRNLVCGYVTWDMTDPDAPSLAALTTSYLDTERLVQLSDEARHAELLRANCAHGDIEDNLDLARIGR